MKALPGIGGVWSVVGDVADVVEWANALRLGSWRGCSTEIVADDSGYIDAFSLTDNIALGERAMWRGRHHLARVDGLRRALIDERSPTTEARLLACVGRAVLASPEVLVVAANLERLAQPARMAIIDIAAERARRGALTVLASTVHSRQFHDADFSVVLRDGIELFAGCASDLPAFRASLLATATEGERISLTMSELGLQLTDSSDRDIRSRRLANIIFELIGGGGVGVAVCDAEYRFAGRVDAIGQLRTALERCHGVPNTENPRWVDERICVVSVVTQRGQPIATVAMWGVAHRLTPVGLADLAARLEELLSEIHRHDIEADAAQAVRRASSLRSVVGGLAHDFGNSLQSMIGLAELIEPDDGGHLEHLLEVGANAEALVAKLLAFSDFPEVDRAATDVHLALEIAIEQLMRSGAIVSPVEVRRLFDATDSAVMADPSELVDVFSKLLINAVQVSSGPAVLVVVRTASDTSSATVEFIDEGPGFSDRQIELLFEPSITVQGASVGVGVGLAAAASTVHDLHGRIEVTDTSTSGSTIAVSLPLAGTVSLATPAAPASAAVGNRSPAARSPGVKWALVCDDDASVRSVLGELLRHLGYSVVEVSDGRECIERVTVGDEWWDAVLIDHVMPGLTGDAVIRELREMCPELPMIWISGYRAGDMAGMADVDSVVRLTKPIRLRELEEALARVDPGEPPEQP